MSLRIVPDIVLKPILYSLEPTATVRKAAKTMAERSIGAIVVIENGVMIGIFSERDLLTRVVAKGLDPDTAVLQNVMTKDVETVTPNSTCDDAIAKMKKTHCRHLPIVDKGRVLGMVSVRDLYEAINQSLEEEVKEKEAFVFGRAY